MGSYFFVFLEVFDHEGGIQSYNRTLLQSYHSLQSQSGCDIPEAEIFILRDRPQADNPLASSRMRFHYFKHPVANLGRLWLVGSLLLALLQRRPRRVFCGHINLVPLIQPLCRNLGIPYTVITHGKEVWSQLPGRLGQGLRQADAIWTVSRYSRDRATAANQLDPDRLHLLPCSIDGTLFTPGEKSPELLDRYGLAGHQVLMTVARLWSGDIYKGVDVTIRALPRIAQEFPTVKYLVVGRGDDQPRLARLAEELGVSDRVVFAGFVPTEELVNHYRLADAYIMPSQEGFGIVYLEAMACGVPVLAGDADGSADPLQDGQLGWQVPHRDPEAVATACLEILQGRQQRCDGTWLREQSLAIFDTAAFQQRLKELVTAG